MRSITIVALFMALVTVSACGRTPEQRAATGGLGGLLVAGPVGAAVGAGAGVVAGEVAR